MTDGGQTWSDRLEVMLDPPHHSGGEETTVIALADGTLLAICNGGASVFLSTVSTPQLNLVTLLQ